MVSLNIELRARPNLMSELPARASLFANNLDLRVTGTASMRGIASRGATLFKEHVTHLAHGLSKKITPLLLWPEHDQVYQAFPHLCNQLRQIDGGISSNFNVLSHDIIYVAV
jgi:hypothetical protein